MSISKVYKIVDCKGRIYIPVSMRKEVGINCGDIVKLKLCDNGDIGIEKIRIIEFGDKSTQAQAVEDYVFSAVKKMKKETLLNLANEVIKLAGSKE